MRAILVSLLVISVVVFCGGATVANASFITTDGDFGAQFLDYGTYGDVRAPWTAGTQIWIGTTDEVSPFTNVFPANSKGMGINGGFDDTIWAAQTGSTTVAADAVGKVTMNVDFKNMSEAEGTYSIVVSKDNSYANRTAALHISGLGVWAETTNANYGTSLLDPVAGTWYNAQLTLDMATNTYSGTITAYGGDTTDISSRSFATENAINSIFTLGTVGPTPNITPGHRLDNWVLTYAVPEPGPIALLATGLISLLAYAWRKRK